MGRFWTAFNQVQKIECVCDMCNENSAKQHGAAAGSVRAMQQVEYHQMYSNIKSGRNCVRIELHRRSRNGYHIADKNNRRDNHIWSLLSINSVASIVVTDRTRTL